MPGFFGVVGGFAAVAAGFGVVKSKEANARHSEQVEHYETFQGMDYSTKIEQASKVIKNAKRKYCLQIRDL